MSNAAANLALMSSEKRDHDLVQAAMVKLIRHHLVVSGPCTMETTLRYVNQQIVAPAVSWFVWEAAWQNAWGEVAPSIYSIRIENSYQPVITWELRTQA